MEELNNKKICINCEENEVSDKDMLLCDDCIVHLNPSKQ